MNKVGALEKLFEVIINEAKQNESFREKLELLFAKPIDSKDKSASSTRKRNPGVLDPMAVFKNSPEIFKETISKLSVEELKDIVSENGMDRAKLALKWKNKERLVDLIVDTVKTRLQKGDAFRNQ